MTTTIEPYAQLNIATQAILHHYIKELKIATTNSDTKRILIINSVICSLAPQLFVEKQLK